MVVLFYLLKRERDVSNKSKNHLKGWQLLIVAAVFYILGLTLGGAIGDYLQIAGQLFIVFAIVTGIINLVRKDKESKV